MDGWMGGWKVTADDRWIDGWLDGLQDTWIFLEASVIVRDVRMMMMMMNIAVTSILENV